MTTTTGKALVSLALLVCVCVPAQLLPPGIGVPPVRQRVPEAQPAPGHERERETIARCLRDLSSDDVKARRRAILVIGKYPVPQAQAAVIAALKDADEMVRRSALVSISEQQVILPPAHLPVVRMLRDSDVHIRRIASSMLPDVLRFSRMLSPQRRPLRPVRPGKTAAPLPTLTPGGREIQMLLNISLAEEDSAIRKNILSLAGSGRVALDGVRVIACLSDKDRDVRILALQACRRLVGLRPGALLEALGTLVADPDPLVRREVARLLSSCGPDAEGILRKMVADPDSNVRMEAVRQLCLRRSAGVLPLLANVLSDRALSADERAEQVQFLLLYGEEAQPLLHQLARKAALPIRLRAIGMLGRSSREKVGIPFLLELVAEEQSAIRQVALQILIRRARELDEAGLRTIFESEFVDVRRYAVRLASVFRQAVMEEILLDLCLDDDVKVRCTALAQLAQRRISGWETVLTQSLKDPDPSLRMAAADAFFLVKTPESLKAVEAAAAACEDGQLKSHLAKVALHLRGAMRSTGRGRPRPRVGAPTPRRVPVSPRPSAPPVRRTP
ncbi:MAG: HEAT repeat domain-containing protein [Lentisphaeria bacterium]|nr:HEAT repeat domain-containing protein [Lentisphaeria bacterium]